MLVRSQGSVCLLIVSLAACIVCAAQHARGEDPPLSVSPQSDWEARIEAALDAKGEWAFEGVPLIEVCAAMQEKLGIDIVLDVKALEDHAVDSSTPITQTLSGISNRSFLRLILSEIEWTYIPQHGALWITTFERAEASLTTRVYSIGDLIVRDPTLGASPPGYSLLLQAIQGSIARDLRGINGLGRIEGIYGGLIVTHTPDVHEQVTEFLTAYRDIIASEKAGHEQKRTVYLLGHDEVSAAIGRALDRPFTAEFKDTSLKEVAEFISEKMGIPIVIDTHVLEDFGIDSTVPITGKFNETRLRFAIERMLSELELTYIIRNEVLLITTREQSKAQLLIGFYPVRDLVQIGDDSWIEPLGARCDFESLKNVIQSTIAPDTWDEVGGPSSIGHLLPVPTIVIAQSQDAHEQISELLSRLRVTKELEPVSHGEFDPNAHIVRSYPVNASSDEVAALIIRASEPGTWRDEAGTFVQGLGGSVVVKHNGSIHRRVRKLLSDVGLGHFTGGLGGGGGFGGGAAGGTSGSPNAPVNPPMPNPAPGGGGGFF